MDFIRVTQLLQWQRSVLNAYQKPLDILRDKIITEKHVLKDIECLRIWMAKFLFWFQHHICTAMFEQSLIKYGELHLN